jgi:hypothetical protein
MVKTGYIIVLAAVTAAGIAWGAVPLEGEPFWESNETDYATGGVCWDVNGDGWLDFLMGNGNDMEKNRDAVYFNHNGDLEAGASWRSSDSGFDGHIDVGDVDGDGDVDLVVTGFLDPHAEQLYRNDGGRFTTSPVWTCNDADDSFSCALGDVDNDGDLDLATCSGYFDPAAVKVFLNRDGSLERVASWRTPVVYNANDVAWCDVDNDGDLDLAIAGHGEACHLFENEGGTLNRAPIWASTATAQFNQLTFGDVDGDGWRDLAVSDNNHGRVLLYMNNAGTLDADYVWSAAKSRAAPVKFGDVDGDGDEDLAAGGWWSDLSVYENRGGSLAASPGWEFYPESGALVCEQIVWADMDNDGLRPEVDAFDGDGARKLFYLGHRPLHYFDYVKVGGRKLGSKECCFHPEDGWVSLAQAPAGGAGNVEVGYIWSADLDLGVTNWDQPAGSYFFGNNGGPSLRLGEFRAGARDGYVAVRWALITPVEGCNLYRREVGLVGAATTKLNTGLLPGGVGSGYDDYAVSAGRSYDYWLEAVTAVAARTFGPVRATAGRPASFTLAQNYPNPAGDRTTIVFTVTSSTTATLGLFDVAGRRVGTLFEGSVAAGSRLVAVNVDSLPPGVYIYRLELENGDVAARKMVVTR